MAFGHFMQDWFVYSGTESQTYFLNFMDLSVKSKVPDISLITPEPADELCICLATGHPRHGPGQQHTHRDCHYCQAQRCSHLLHWISLQWHGEQHVHSWVYDTHNYNTQLVVWVILCMTMKVTAWVICNSFLNNFKQHYLMLHYSHIQQNLASDPEHTKRRSLQLGKQVNFTWLTDNTSWTAAGPNDRRVKYFSRGQRQQQSLFTLTVRHRSSVQLRHTSWLLPQRITAPGQ